MSAKEKEREGNVSAVEMKTQEWKSSQSPLQFCRCVVAVQGFGLFLGTFMVRLIVSVTVYVQLDTSL